MNDPKQPIPAPERKPFFARGSEKLAVSTQVRAGLSLAKEEAAKRG